MNLTDLTLAGLQLIETVVTQLRAAHAGTISAADALAQINTVHTQLLADQNTDDAALAAKFPDQK